MSVRPARPSIRGVLINDGHDLDRPPVSGGIKLKVHRPHPIRRIGYHILNRGAQPRCSRRYVCAGAAATPEGPLSAVGLPAHVRQHAMRPGSGGLYQRTITPVIAKGTGLPVFRPTTSDYVPRPNSTAGRATSGPREYRAEALDEPLSNPAKPPAVAVHHLNPPPDQIADAALAVRSQIVCCRRHAEILYEITVFSFQLSHPELEIKDDSDGLPADTPVE